MKYLNKKLSPSKKAANFCPFFCRPWWTWVYFVRKSCKLVASKMNQSGYVNFTCDDVPLLDNNNLLSNIYFKTSVITMYSIIFVIAVIGNGLVCYLVLSSSRMRTVTNYFIMNLAVGDMLITIFCVPFTSIAILKQYWEFGSFMCLIVNYSSSLSVFVSAYTLVAISIDRYMVIMWPLKPRISKSMAITVIVIVWTVAGITVIPVGIFTNLIQPPDTNDSNAVYKFCDLWVYLLYLQCFVRRSFLYGELYWRLLVVTKKYISEFNSVFFEVFFIEMPISIFHFRFICKICYRIHNTPEYGFGL